MLTVVLDVNVVVSAVMSPHGAPRQVLEAWQAGSITVLTATGIIEEVPPSSLIRPSAVAWGSPLPMSRRSSCFLRPKPGSWRRRLSRQ